MNASKGSVRKRWECSLEFTLQIDFTCKHDPHRTSVDKFTHSILLLKALRTLFRLCRCISNNGETGEESVIGEKRKGLTGWMSFSCLSHCTSWIISSHNVFSLLFMYIKPFIKRKCQGFTEGFWKCSFYAYYVHLSMASRKSTQVLIAGKQRETEAIKSDLVLKALLKDFCSTFKLSLKKKQTKCFLLSGKLYTCSSFYSKKIHWTYCWCWSWPTTWRCRPGRSAWCSSCAGRESSWWRWTASGSPQRSQACSSRGSSSCLS